MYIVSEMRVYVQVCVSLCVLVIFNTSFKNIKLLKFQLSKADGLNGAFMYVT